MRETRMVTVYPILHASAALNYLEFPENKLLAESHSGMLTLHGLVEQPNRRALLNSIARLHTETLPQLRNELASSVKDADNAIPQALVVLAQKMLKKHNALEELQLDVRKDFIKAKTDMREVIEGYFFGDADVYEILAAARTTGRRRRWDELKAKVKSTRSALQLLDRNAGSKGRGLEMLAVALPAETLGDYDVLVELLRAKIEELRKAVLVLVVDRISKLHACDSSAAKPLLLQTVYDNFLSSPLQKRADEFWVASQKPLDLQSNEPEKYLTKLIQKVRAPPGPARSTAIGFLIDASSPRPHPHSP